MSSPNRPPITVSVAQLPRARRISDEEWEKYRKILVKLYLEEGISRKGIISKIAKDHSFVFTEKQLKHRFQKWGVRKYIPESDMNIMLSVKRKRHAKGKDVRFEYKGLDIEQERIERAHKRQKRPLVSPIDVPACIKAFTPPPHDNMANAASIETLTRLDEILLDSSARIADSNSATSDTYSKQELADVTSDDLNIVNMTDDLDNLPDIPSPQFPEASFTGPVCGHNTSLDVQQQSFSSVDNYSARSMREASVCLSEFFDFSPVSKSPNRLTVEPFSNAEINRRALSRGSSFSLEEVAKKGELQAVNRPNGPLLANALEAVKTPSWSICTDMDPEKLIVPLQLLQKQFSSPLDDSFLEKCTWAAGSSLDILFELINSEWLRIEIEDLVCWSYVASVEAVQQRQAARKVPVSGTTPEMSSGYQSMPRGQDARKSSFEPELPTRDTSYFVKCSRKGVLRVQLSTTSREVINDTDTAPLIILTVSFMPKSKRRKMRVSARFTKPWNALVKSQTSPFLKTFNVVHQESKIIQCIGGNNLEGVHALLERKEASPLDVDEWGFSLLSYAIHTGCSDIFRLLLAGGAGTYNCNLGSYTSDIISTIWHYFADYNYGPESTELWTNNIRDVDQCLTMTELVLNQGFDMENTIYYDESIAGPLYEITMAEYLPPSAPEKALEFLIDAGYDKEKRNSIGQTPLLHSANSCAPQVIKYLKVFVRKGVNVHAVDITGRGALHSALASPNLVKNWNFLNAEADFERLNSFPCDFYWTCSNWYCTEDDTHAEDYGFDAVAPTQHSAMRPVHGDIMRSATRVEADVAETHDFLHLELVAHQVYETRDLIASDDGNRLDFDLEVDNVAIFDANGSRNNYSDEVELDKHHSGPQDEPADEYVYCKDLEGLERRIQNPYEVLKRRLRFKLLVLLEAGCDPNAVDKDGQSVSDHATQFGLLPQWTWALDQTGYMYDVISDSWMKALTSACSA